MNKFIVITINSQWIYMQLLSGDSFLGADCCVRQKVVN